MRHLAALALLLAAGCSDSSADGPDALRGTCGDAGQGMQWINQSGCTPTCSPVDGSVVSQVCPAGNGTRFCALYTDPRNCGECGHNCIYAECAPAGGIVYTATCNAGRCRCASP